MKKINKNGFTLIELLAVIIILGILMIIAIPSVTKYISDSRKSTYIDTAKEIVGGTRNLVNEGKLGMYDTNTTYYIPAKYIKTENASKSPYGEFTEAYVAVIYNGVGYNYYWISTDDAGQGVKELMAADDLDIEDIVSDLNDNDISSVVESTGIGNRDVIKILNPNTGHWNEVVSGATKYIPEEKEKNVEYPEGKDRYTVEVGDTVKIKDEEFNVIKKDRSELVLLAKYNLKVGSIANGSGTITGQYTNSDSGYGLQDSSAKGYEGMQIRNGVLAFSNTNYWLDYDKYSLDDSVKRYYNVLSNDSLLKKYIDNYKDYIENQVGKNIKARLLRYSEAISLGCSAEGNGSCNSAPSFVHNTSFWLETVAGYNKIFVIYSNNIFVVTDYDKNNLYGVRPVIII